jgi:hypothetical protein
LREEKHAVGKTRNRIVVDLAANRFESRRFFFEHGFQPAHHGVHRESELLEFRYLGFFDGAEAPLADGARLVDHPS